MKRFLFFLLLFLVSDIHAQSRWLLDRFDVPSLTKIMSVAVANGNDFVVSVDGFGMNAVLRSSDGGKEWKKVFDLEIGGVLSFYDIAHPTPDLILLAIDSDFSYKVDENMTVFAEAGSILRSSDGGKTWQQTTFGVRDINNSHNIQHIKMIDDKIGVAAVVLAPFYLTTDGGITWNAMPSPLSEMYAVTAMDMPDASTIVVATNSPESSNGTYKRIMYRTTNQGATWDSSSVAPPNMRDLKMIDRNTGFAVGYDWNNLRGHLYKTVDGGLNWNSIFDTVQLGGGDPLISVDFSDKNTGYVVGREGLIMSTTDGGATWKRETIDISKGVDMGAFFDVNAYAPNKVIAVGGDGAFVTLQQKPLLPTPWFVTPSYGNPVPRVFTAKWLRSEGATHYELQLLANDGLKTLLKSETNLKDTEYVFNQFWEDSYFIQVRALNDDNVSNWSKVLFYNNVPLRVTAHEREVAFSIYPNPVKDNALSLNWNNKERRGVYQVRIVDLLGREMQAATAMSPRVTLDVSHLQPGSYYMMVTTPEGDQVRPFVKE